MYTIISTEQGLFYWCLQALLTAGRLLFKALIFSPQLVSGYLLSAAFLNSKSPPLLWMACIAMVSALCYAATLVLKSAIASLYQRSHWGWLPLLLVAVTYTCVLPVYLVYEPIAQLMGKVSATDQAVLTWIACGCFGACIFSRYRFLEHQ